MCFFRKSLKFFSIIKQKGFFGFIISADAKIKINNIFQEKHFLIGYNYFIILSNIIMDLNKVQIIWRITQDIELKQTPSGQSVTNLSVATNRRWTDQSGIQQEIAEFHNVVLWGKTAEIAGQYLSKGKRVYIEGRLQTRSWEAQDWTKRYRTEIVWENMIMLDGSTNTDIPHTPARDDTPVSTTWAVKKSKAKDEEEISIEDVPF